MEERKLLLERLICLEEPLSEIEKLLNPMGWAWDGEELVNLKPSHIISILERYLAGQMTALQVEDWANAVECREDIIFGNDDDELTMDAINELANPVLEGDLTPKSPKALVDRLRVKP